MFSNEDHIFGSASVASGYDLAKAGLYKASPDGILLGFNGKRPLYFAGQGGVLTIAGPRSGKLRDILGYTICGAGYQGNIIALDVKGELSHIAANQAHTNRHIVHINPYGLHGLGQDKIDLLGHIRLDSPTLISDIKTQCSSVAPESGAPNAAFFEIRAQEYAEAIALTIVERDGALSLGAWYNAISQCIEGGDEWIEFAFRMYESRFKKPRLIEGEIDQNRKAGTASFHGILGELSKAFRACSDPRILEAFSPPFDFSFEEMLSDHDTFFVSVILPQELMDVAAMPIKLLFGTAFTLKSRAPRAPGQLWIFDEAPSLGANPILVRAHTIGAGMNIRPWTIAQSFAQLDAFGPKARDIIMASSSVRQVFGVRDLATAKMVSEMCGDQTLSHDNRLQQMQAAQRKQAAAIAIINGQDFLKTAMTYRAERDQQQHRAQIKRPLRTPEEVLNAPPNMQFIFSDHVQKLIYCERRAYYDQPWMAGRFFPNPYHQRDLSKVQTKNALWGRRWRRVMETDPPERFEHLRQYQTRPFRYIEGFKP